MKKHTCKYCKRVFTYNSKVKDMCNPCKGLLTYFNNDISKLEEHYYWINYFNKNSLNVDNLSNSSIRKKYKHLKELKVQNIHFNYHCDFCNKLCEISYLNICDNGNRKKFVKFCKGHSIAAGKIDNGYKVLMDFKKFINTNGDDFIDINNISNKTKELMKSLPNKLWNIKGNCELCNKEFKYKNITLHSKELIPVCQYHKDRFTKFGEKEYRKAYSLYNEYFLNNSKNNPIKLSEKNLINVKYIIQHGFGAVKYHFYFEFKCLDCKEVKIKRFGYENLNDKTYFDRCHYCSIAKNNIEKYGYKSPQFQDPKNRKRNDKIKRHKYGSASAVGNYRYENELFNSSWELAFWIYHRDKNHPIKREPIAFDYYVGKQLHQYWPDFRVFNKYYEIKGNRFLIFNKNGKIIDLQSFDRKRTKEDSAKYKCLVEHNVTLITSKQIGKYLKYVEITYGKGYLNKYKIKEIKNGN